MIVSIYSPSPARIPEYAANGFTHIGPIYNGGAPADILASCRANDLKLIYRPDSVGTQWEFATAADRTAILDGVTDQEIIDHAEAAIALAQANADVIDTIYCPIEELRYWRASEKRFFDLYRSTCLSHGMTFYMYQAGHYLSVALTETKGDLCNMGAYNVNSPDRLAKTADTIDRLMIASRHMKNTPTLTMQLFVDDNLHDMRYIGLEFWRAVSSGVLDFVIFSGFETRPGMTTFSEQIDEYFEHTSLLASNKDILESTESAPLLGHIAYTDSVRYTNHLGDKLSKDGLSYKTYSFAGSQYLLVVNISEHEALFELGVVKRLTDLTDGVITQVEHLSVPELSHALYKVEQAPVPGTVRYAMADLPGVGSVLSVTMEGGPSPLVGVLTSKQVDIFTIDNVPVNYENVVSISAAEFTELP